MKPSDVVEIMKVHIQAKTPVFLWGAPGVGKSSIVARLAKDLGMELIDLRLSQMEPVDLLGLPTIENGRTNWAVPSVFPDSGKGILFLDEANAAPREILAAAYQLVLDRQIGQYHVPEDWVICLAGNRAEDHAIVTQMPAPLNNRMAHIDFDLNSDDWFKWAVQSGIRPEIVSFLRFRPATLHDFSPDHKAWPSPRTWEKVNEALKFSPRNLEHEIVKSLVGEGAAAEYISFVRFYQDLPTMDAIIKNPKRTKVPTEPASRFALAGMLGHNMKASNLDKVMLYLKRLPKEFQVPAIQSAVQRDDTLTYSAEILDWIDNNSEIFVS